MNRTTHNTPSAAWLALHPPIMGADGEDPPADQTVPYERFKAVTDSLGEARSQLADVQRQLSERRREGLGEVEQLKAQVADLTRERDTIAGERDEAVKGREQAETSAKHLERSGWIRDAAAAVKLTDGEAEVSGRFHDPADAIARINLDDVRSPEAAQRAVSELAGRSRHLVAVATGEDSPRSRADLMERVLANGKPPTEGDPAVGDEPRDDLLAAYAPPAK